MDTLELIYKDDNGVEWTSGAIDLAWRSDVITRCIASQLATIKQHMEHRQ